MLYLPFVAAIEILGEGGRFIVICGKCMRIGIGHRNMATSLILYCIVQRKEGKGYAGKCKR